MAIPVLLGGLVEHLAGAFDPGFVSAAVEVGRMFVVSKHFFELGAGFFLSAGGEIGFSQQNSRLGVGVGLEDGFPSGDGGGVLS